MNLKRSGLVLPAVLLAALWGSSAQALLIDSFDTDASAFVMVAAPNSDSTFTPDGGADMIGDRTLTVDKTAGGSGGANGAFADVLGGLLAMANGPVTNSNITLDWSFASTDLTEGGTKTGIFLSLPDPIDNELAISISINGGTSSSMVFADGSSGPDFFFPFVGFANGGDAATATTVSIVFSSSDNAWDAQVDFIETIGPPVPPPGGNVSAPAPLALLGIGLAGLCLSRRRTNAA